MNLGLGKAGLNPLHQQTAQPAALTVYNHNFHKNTSFPHPFGLIPHRIVQGGGLLSSIYNANSGELLTMAVALSAVLAQGQSQANLAKLGAFFTIVGDTLNLYALQPSQVDRAGTALSLADNL